MNKKIPIYYYLLTSLILVITSCTSDGIIDLPDYFVKFYAEAEAVEILGIDDGGFVLVGKGPDNESFIIRVDERGNSLWQQEISDFQARDVVDNTSSFSGDYIMLGDFNQSSASDLRVVFYTSGGIKLGGGGLRPDLTQLGQDRCTSVFTGSQMMIDDRDGLLVIMGESMDCNGFIKPFVLKINQIGNVLWTHELGLDDLQSNVTLSKSMISDGAAQLVLAYNVADPAGSFVRIVRLDMDSGIETSMGTLGVGENIIANEMIPTSFGYVIAGTRQSAGGTQMRLIHLNTQGQEINNSFSPPRVSSTKGNSVYPTSEAGFVIGGRIQAFTNGDFVLMKTNESGEPVWEEERVIGGREGDESGSIVMETEGNDGYVIFGTSRIETKPRMTLVKTNRDGKLVD